MELCFSWLHDYKYFAPLGLKLCYFPHLMEPVAFGRRLLSQSPWPHRCVSSHEPSYRSAGRHVGAIHYRLRKRGQGCPRSSQLKFPTTNMTNPIRCTLATVLSATLLSTVVHAQTAAKDWPMYNHDVLGTRHNRDETAIGPDNASRLVEKWRFPAAGSDLQIGVIHGTPIVVGGYVYFGTATDPTFYKLTPDGKVRWSYRNPVRPRSDAAPKDEASRHARFQSSAEGVLGSALVTEDTVFFGDIGGWFYALDRANGAERWKLNARASEFPGAHPLNTFFASPILADGKLIVGGGALEQVVAAFPGYKGCTGRGFVLALDPKTGQIIWKYDLGPKPEPLDPPINIKDSWGDHVFYFGPATSTVWSTPSYDAESGTIFFGTDVNTAPRRPTKDDLRFGTRESCGIVALNVRDGSERWITQINPGDVWTNAMRSYDPKEGRYKDQSIGDTPKIYSITINGTRTKVIGVGCKNGGFYILRAQDGRILDHTPIYTGPPSYPPTPKPDPRMLALPSPIGGLQTGCATDGETIFVNGIDALFLGSQEKQVESGVPPTGGRITAVSLDTKTERWRHERPKVASLGGPAPKPLYKNAGDPVASGIAVANGVLYFTAVGSGKLVALNATTGGVLKEIAIGPVWSGPSVSRGRIYIGTGNTLFSPADYEAFFPKKYTGVLHCFGLPGEDEVSRLGTGKE
jgi:polyvinyl alcohol dehydrogenase (cytochrome)